MHQIKVNHLIEIANHSDHPIENDFQLEINRKYFLGKGEVLLKEVFDCLQGIGEMPVLEVLKFDFKINRHVFIYDNAAHFNRYRLQTLKTDLYSTFSYPWTDSYKRLCRTFEKECLKSGLHDRVWNGPPIAKKLFGKSEMEGNLSGNGSAGWKLNAFNDTQYDLNSRLHGFKLIRIPEYENLMMGGSLRKIGDLLLNPKENEQQAILKWISRKLV